MRVAASDPSDVQTGGRLALSGDRAAAAVIMAAGARARAAADACEAIGLGAVLLDASGRVLHVGSAAAALFGRTLRVQSENLIGADPVSNRAIEAVLGPVLGVPHPGTRPGSLPVEHLDSQGTLVVAAVPFRDESPVQLLRAVLLIGRSPEVLRRQVAVLPF